MRYMKLQIATLFCEVYYKGKFVRRTPSYFTVMSTKLGRCGHKHKSKVAAEPCLRRMKKQLRRSR